MHQPIQTPRVHSALTRQESRVLQYVADGLDSEDIAQKLGLSTHTVNAHMRNLTRKMHAASRSQAVAIGLRAGWIR